MHINNTSVQLNPLNEIQHNVTSPTLKNTLGLLAKQTGTLDKLAITHRFADTQIDHLDQEKGKLFEKLDFQLESSSSNTDVALSTESLALNDKIITKTRVSAERNNAAKEALVNLKTRDFQPAENAALSVPLSGKGFGGFRGARGGHTSRAERLVNNRIAELNGQITEANESLARSHAQIEQLNKTIAEIRSRGTVTRDRQAVINASEVLIGRVERTIASIEEARNIYIAELQALTEAVGGPSQ